MKDYFLSLQPLLKKYLIEICLIAIAGALALGALLMQPVSSKQGKSDNFIKKVAPAEKERIYVDIEGAVNKPGLYEFSALPRLKEVLDKAEGVSEEVDHAFFNRNFNLAKIVTDQEKIYIPSRDEVMAGITAPNAVTTSQLNANEGSTNSLVGINSASLDQLDSLPGVGQVTAQKIVDNRPYQSIEELNQKKILKSNVFDQVKNLISLD